MTKFVKIDSFVAMPGSCVSCGSPNGPAVDTSISVDYFGAVVFCIPCAKDLGRVAGLVDPEPLIEKPPVAENVSKDELSDYFALLGNFMDATNHLSNRMYDLLHSVEDSDGASGESINSDKGSVRVTKQVSNSVVSKDSAGVSISSSNGPTQFDLN